MSEKKLTPENITDQEIRELKYGLFPQHYMYQFCVEALDETGMVGDSIQWKAKRECAFYLNNRKR